MALLDRHSLVIGSFKWTEFDDDFLTKNVESVSVVDVDAQAGSNSFSFYPDFLVYMLSEFLHFIRLYLLNKIMFLLFTVVWFIIAVVKTAGCIHVFTNAYNN